MTSQPIWLKSAVLLLYHEHNVSPTAYHQKQFYVLDFRNIYISPLFLFHISKDLTYWYCHKWLTGIDSVGVLPEAPVVSGPVSVTKSGPGIPIYGEFFWGNWVYNTWSKSKTHIKW